MNMLRDVKCGCCMRRRFLDYTDDTWTSISSGHHSLWFCDKCMAEAEEGQCLASMVDEAIKWIEQEAKWAEGK